MLWRVKDFICRLAAAKIGGQAGFTLVEAMVATALMGVGFAGSLTLVSMTRTTADDAVARQKMQMISNQIFEVIESDLANIDSYDMGLTTCNVPAVGETDKFDLRQFQWCSQMANELGAAQVTDLRQINVTTLADGRKVVHVKLETKNQTVQVLMKRTYNNS